MTFGTESVSVAFGPIRALRSVSLAVPQGEIVAVVGGDGSGKSTLLRSLVGLVDPDEGAVRRPAVDRIGYLPTGAGSWPNLTVDENIEFVGSAFGLRSSELSARAGDLLERSGLASARSRLASRLSGGMRTKLGFCLAMLGRPDLLVLDEPTTGVDPVSRVDLWRLVSETAADGTAVAMATSYLDEAERAGSVTLLESGRVLLAGRPDELIGSLEGEIVRTSDPVHADRAWRSGAGFREWWPDGAPQGSEIVEPDLADLAIVSEIVATAGARGTS